MPPEIFVGLDPWVLPLAIIVTVLAAARLTRLVAHDTFPPILWFKRQWDKITEKSTWNMLLYCHWCFSFWATAFVIGTFFLTFLAVWIAWAWWVLMLTLALSYLVAQYVHFDSGKD